MRAALTSVGQACGRLSSHAQPLLILAALVSLMVPAGAGARPTLSLAAAEHAARHMMIATALEQNELAEEQGGPMVLSSTLGECTVERYRALCDETDVESDGTVESNTIELWLSASGHIGTRWLADESEAG
jgi:hypothetical protein